MSIRRATVCACVCVMGMVKKPKSLYNKASCMPEGQEGQCSVAGKGLG